jgi:hypothetical protein
MSTSHNYSFAEIPANLARDNQCLGWGIHPPDRILEALGSETLSLVIIDGTLAAANRIACFLSSAMGSPQEFVAELGTAFYSKIEIECRPLGFQEALLE